MQYYQEEDPERVEIESSLFSKSIEEPCRSESSGYIITAAKAAIVLVCIGTVAVLVGSNSPTGNLSKSRSYVISQLTSLDQLPADTVFSTTTEDDQVHLFGLFAKKYGRSYGSDYSSRLEAFKTSLKTIDSRNSKESPNQGARHGITKFSDLTEEEFKERYLKARKPSGKESRSGSSDAVGTTTSSESSVDADTANSIVSDLNGVKEGVDTDDRMPWEAELVTVEKYTGSLTARDWSGVLTTAVQDQGYCGSCWAFSTASQVESDSIRKNLLTTDDLLSTQELVSCDKWNLGCNGGWTELGFDFVSRYGIELAVDYPYNSYYDRTWPCQGDVTKSVVTITGYYGIQTEEEMMDYVLETGPLSICVASSEWMTYTGGVLTSCKNGEDDIDHCVQLVGVDKSEGYWKIRNTWGTDWGEDGYIRVATGGNLCGVTTDPIFTEPALVDSENSLKRI